MAYKVRLYKNTGFNAVNIPDGLSLLEQFEFFDTQTIEIMQNRFLSSVRVSATWADIKNCDYLRIYNTGTNGDFYVITAMKMLAKDVCELSVVYDYITSSGGVNNLQILDGVTARVHVTDDGFGKYCESDPLTAPAQPLEIDTRWFSPSTDAHAYIEATVNIPRTGGAVKGTQYTDDAGTSVTIPTVRSLEKYTSYALASGVSASINPSTMLYDLNDLTAASGANGWDNKTSLLNGIKRCRELGIESGAIINQVEIPLVYAEATNVTVQDVFVDSSSGLSVSYQEVVDRSIVTFTGKTGNVDSQIPYSYSGAKNNRVNYGEYTPYGIITCSGESCEYRAEDIRDANNPNTPVMKFVVDPHTDGKPYFRWRVVNNDATDIGFFKNCVTGLKWKQIPLYFSSPSGTALNTLRYQNSRKISDTGYEIQREKLFVNAFEGATVGAVQGAAQMATGDIAGAAGSIAGAMMSTINYGIETNQAERAYLAQKNAEMSDYLVQNTVAAPTINFPYNSEMMRDFYGNGALMYRYRYSAADIARIDKLLNMYGYRFTKPLEKTDFTSREKFNYVECANVSVTGHSTWMNNGIATMLKAGVRVWHVKPNPSIYNQTNAVVQGE